jgi:hypothetical protein
MSNNASVVVFPSVFTQNKVASLLSNVKKILKIRNQKFQKIRIDDSIIVLDANDPVFASSAINLLYGIERTAIAKCVKNDFDTVVAAITKIGSNLLLKGDKFFVKVEGYSSGYIPKDIEISATSSLIEKTSKLGAKPGIEEKFDKLLYTYLTKSNAYVCIFTDKGLGGIPYNSQNEKIVCGIYDELSAVSCLETIKEGFDVKIIVCYRNQNDLLNLVKILNKIIPRTIQSNLDLEFFKIIIKGKSSQSFLKMIETITEILLSVAKLNKVNRVSLAISPLIFPQWFIDNNFKRILQKKLFPLFPLSGLDDNLLENAKAIGLGKYLLKIEKLGKMKFNRYTNTQKEIQKCANQALKTRKKISVTIGPNNVHEILDSLKVNH